MSAKFPCFPRNAELPTPGKLKELTSAFGSRSKSILAMDAAYENYYDLWKKIREMDPLSKFTLQNMSTALYSPVSSKAQETKAWQDEKQKSGVNYPPRILYGTLNHLSSKSMTNGKAWSGTRRNKDQVLEKLFNYLNNEHLELTLDGAVAAGVPSRLESNDIPHARLGVLYLFANIQVNLEPVAIVNSAIGNLVENITSFEYIEDALDETNITFGLSLPEAMIFSAGDVMSGGSSAGNAIGGIVAKNRTATGPAGFPRHKVKRTETPHEAVQTSSFRKAWAWVKKKFSELCEWVLNKFYWVKNKIYTNEESIIKVGGSLFRKLLADGLTKLLEQLIKNTTGVVGDLVEGVKALGVALVKGIDCIKVRKDADVLKINPGHPALIVKALNDAATDEFKKSGIDAFLAVLKATLSSALAVLSVGSSQIITSITFAVVSTLKWFYDTYQTYSDAKKINEFVAEAKVEYEKAKILQANESDLVIAKSDSICHQPEKFTEFFNKACEVSNTLPLLALNSGISGDFFVFIRMVSDYGDSLIKSTDEEMKKYVLQQSNILSDFKSRARTTLRDSGLTFTSEKNDIKGYLRHAIEHHQQGKMSWGDRASAFFLS